MMVSINESLVTSTYLLYLFLHGFDVVLARFDLFLEFLDLIIQHKLKLLQLLVLLLQIIDSLLLFKKLVRQIK